MIASLTLLFNTCRSQISFLWHKGEGPIRPSGNDASCFAASRIPKITSYMPNIVYSFRSFTSVLACNYYRLRSLLLVVTLLINLLLLTFQASYSSCRCSSVSTMCVYVLLRLIVMLVLVIPMLGLASVRKLHVSSHFLCLRLYM